MILWSFQHWKLQNCIYQPVPLHTDPVPPSINQCQLIRLLLGITDFCTVYPGSCTYTAHHKFSGALNLGLSDSHPSLDTKRHPLLSWPFQDTPLLKEKVFGCNEIICNDMHTRVSHLHFLGFSYYFRQGWMHVTSRNKKNIVLLCFTSINSS